MIWAKTAAGRTEMQTRALVKERAVRNLLLVIDGTKSDELLLGSLAGISRADFATLETLGLIAPLAPKAALPAARGTPAAAPPAAAAPSAETALAPSASGFEATQPIPTTVAPLDYGRFTAALTSVIANELGLRGFMLTLAVEKAGTVQELQNVAQRALDLIFERKGQAVASAARRTLYGQ